ncbi:MAG: sensor histidine kinase [Candidatus Sungbacteria bacterium]|nr:sensor histidine kinase [Candidatus Sungbacteria bacterium]
MMTIASPVFGKERGGGEPVLVAVLTGEINIRSFGAIVSNAHLGNTGFMYLVDRDGRLLSEGEKKERYYNLSTLPLVYDILHGRDRIGRENLGYYDGFFKNDVLASGISIPNLGWGLIAEWPREDANSIVNIIQNQNILFSLAVLFIVIIMSLFLADRIVNPIRKLQEGTRRVAKGDFDVNLDVRTNDEIEELGFAFNDMTKGLKEYQALKDEFVFIAAHELRAPVTAIKGYLSMIEEGDAGEVSPKLKEYLTPVSQSNKRLVNLVNDLLEVARQEAGRMTIDVSAVNPAPAILSTIEELKPLAAEKNITVTYDASGAKSILADEARLKEVMVNLLSNAVKYTIGSGTVTIWHEIGDGTLITHMKDAGIGMSLEAQKKLFQKFYRVADERTRSITGTGLGLFIIKQIIEKMNGTIWAESEINKGSTFSFSLPLAK